MRSATARRWGCKSVTGSPGLTSWLTFRPKYEASLMISSGLTGDRPSRWRYTSAGCTEELGDILLRLAASLASLDDPLAEHAGIDLQAKARFAPCPMVTRAGNESTRRRGKSLPKSFCGFQEIEAEIVLGRDDSDLRITSTTVPNSISHWSLTDRSASIEMGEKPPEAVERLWARTFYNVNQDLWRFLNFVKIPRRIGLGVCPESPRSWRYCESLACQPDPNLTSEAGGNTRPRGSRTIRASAPRDRANSARDAISRRGSVRAMSPRRRGRHDGACRRAC